MYWHIYSRIWNTWGVLWMEEFNDKYARPKDYSFIFDMPSHMRNFNKIQCNGFLGKKLLIEVLIATFFFLQLN